MSRLCDECDEKISAKRLKALPMATRCITCQPKFDLNPLEAIGYRQISKALVEMGETDSTPRQQRERFTVGL